VKLALYYYDACPFCQRVLQVVPSLKHLSVELRNTLSDSKYKEELVREGGRLMVPCLRIEVSGKVQWMYESLDIIQYLKKVNAP
jgi:glutaredoxin 2